MKDGTDQTWHLHASPVPAILNSWCMVSQISHILILFSHGSFQSTCIWSVMVIINWTNNCFKGNSLKTSEKCDRVQVGFLRGKIPSWPNWTKLKWQVWMCSLRDRMECMRTGFPESWGQCWPSWTKVNCRVLICSQYCWSSPTASVPQTFFNGTPLRVVSCQPGQAILTSYSSQSASSSQMEFCTYWLHQTWSQRTMAHCTRWQGSQNKVILCRGRTTSWELYIDVRARWSCWRECLFFLFLFTTFSQFCIRHISRHFKKKWKKCGF